MLQRLVDDLKQSTGTTIRITSLALAAAIGLFVTASFLCAAAFVFVLERHGLIAACLTGAAIFFAVTLMTAIGYLVMRRRARKARLAEAAAARPEALIAFADPILIATGFQLARAIGLRRLLPVLAIGGLALGFLASRQPPEEQAPAE